MKKMSKKTDKNTRSKPQQRAAPSPPVIADPETLPVETRYRLQPGDILRLRHTNAYCRKGIYALLSLDTTVCLARTKKRKRKHVKWRCLTNELVYVLLPDLCHFQPTHKRLNPLPEKSVIQGQ